MTESSTSHASREPCPKPASGTRNRRRAWVHAWALPVLAGVLYGLGFAGYDMWPCALVAFVPLFVSVRWPGSSERPDGSGPSAAPLRARQIFARGFVTGFVANAMGYYWLVGMLENFSGFPWIVCVAIALLLCAYQAGLTGTFTLGWQWAQRHGAAPVVAAAGCWVVVEWAYPILFENYYANSVHQLPLAIQIADLGGPLLVSALLLASSAAVYEVLYAQALRRAVFASDLALNLAPNLTPTVAPAERYTSRQSHALRWAGGVLVLWALTLGYGSYRIDQVQKHTRRAPTLMVGAVQVNMGIFSKRDDPREGLRRHIRDSLALEAAVKPDLIVWPESAYTYWIPDSVTNIRKYVTGPLQTPVLFGGLAMRGAQGQERHFNTAFIADQHGNLHGSYDKTYLLAFGEYLPLGEWFPFLYRLSPHTGKFTAGSHVRALPLTKDNRTYRLATLICYEDILPSFVRGMVKKNNPHLLVNITNDAWFGDTLEPWIHLALAKFRSVEHHRYMVRATNSGVSAIIDPTGRVVEHTGVMTRESISHRVALLTGRTLYERFGNWPVGLALMAAAGLLRFGRERTRRG
jgi:apolipoprotein N-acyltransferase